VRKETNLLILLALLNLSPVASAQDDEISDEDLQSLLGDEAESSATEVSEKTDSSESVVIDTDAEAVPEPVSSETVTLDPVTPDPLENLDDNLEPVNPLDVASDTVIAPNAPGDDLEALRSDLEDEGEFVPAPAETVEPVKKAEAPEVPAPVIDAKPDTEVTVFDVGREERELMTLAQNIQGQISNDEWNEVATAAKADAYTVVKNDWLFKISKKLFGSGFYYPKVWSLNSYITNPHFIEPGMVLSFTTGSGSAAPEVKLGTFSPDELNAVPGSRGNTNPTDLANFGEDARPKWMDEKAELKDQGVYFQYASEETMEDLARAGEQALNREYENYEPPRSNFDIIVPQNYDRSGFDKNSRIFYSFKEGFYLSTFVSTNIVQDFGSIVNGPDENIFFTKFDEAVKALPGDKFSIYTTAGKLTHPNSDRAGFKYTIVGQIKLLRKIQDKWEVEFIEVSGTPQRGDRITAYTPKIERITRTYNNRLVEAGILGTFQPSQTILGYGDVIYLDRGRADGVEMGNVFEVYGFKDRLLNKNITNQPTYKVGELTVITLTDNFATAIVSDSIRDFYTGDIAITKTKEAYLRESRARSARAAGKELVGGKALEELDVELNLENLNDDLLKQADKIQLTEDELAELERQEREKSVIKDSERDLQALQRLENEIEHAENILNEAKLDEDKLLENENLNEVEKKLNTLEQDSLDEIEENLGKRYMDEDLNSKENPYGLNEFDIEEIDELLNTEKKTE
jgi:hypothetical protein